MGWNAISAIAGILAAIAVALTVVYLAIQIRKNTLATRSQTYYLATAALADAAAILASNEELARIYRIGLSTPDELTKDDYYRFAMYGTSPGYTSVVEGQEAHLYHKLPRVLGEFGSE